MSEDLLHEKTVEDNEFSRMIWDEIKKRIPDAQFFAMVVHREPIGDCKVETFLHGHLSSDHQPIILQALKMSLKLGKETPRGAEI